MRAGYLPCEAQWVADIAGAFGGRGIEWPDGAVHLYLRWYWRAHRALPSPTAAARLFGGGRWTRSAVRCLLDRPERWEDPHLPVSRNG